MMNDSTDALSRARRERLHSNTIADEADTIWGHDSPVGQYRIQRKANLIRQHIGTGPLHVLEIGCGTGEYTRRFLRNGWHITSLDVSEAMLQHVRRKYGDAPDYLAADAIQLPFTAGCFDVVVGNAILHHLPKTPFAPEIARVLRSGGRAIFAEPNMCNPLIYLQKNYIPLKIKLGDSLEESAFSRNELAHLFQQAGMTATVYPIDFLPPWLPPWLLGWWAVAGMLAEQLPLVREVSGNLLVVAQKGGSHV
jgi:SAM-dependent methyltransferase